MTAKVRPRPAWRVPHLRVVGLQHGARARLYKVCPRTVGTLTKFGVIFSYLTSWNKPIAAARAQNLLFPYLLLSDPLSFVPKFFFFIQGITNHAKYKREYQRK